MTRAEIAQSIFFWRVGATASRNCSPCAVFGHDLLTCITGSLIAVQPAMRTRITNRTGCSVLTQGSQLDQSPQHRYPAKLIDCSKDPSAAPAGCDRGAPAADRACGAAGKRQLAKRRHKSGTVPLDVHPTGERVRRRRPVFYRWLFTRRVTRKRWLTWVHLFLFRRFGPNMQSLTAGFRIICAVGDGEHLGSSRCCVADALIGNPGNEQCRPLPLG